ncbi:MAG TPA: hypothetical protein ENN96_01160 [Candidatus Acetothermia bacterium]|nr:hypothetical protein [Candidatus Acetothermia bacterium]
MTAQRRPWSPATAFSLGRPIDLRYPTNVSVVVLALLCLTAGAVTLIIQDVPWVEAIREGTLWAGALLLGWALGRETDPDHPLSAFAAAAGSLVGSWLLGPPGFLLSLWMLLAMRAINGSPGATPGALDLVVLAGASLWLAVSVHWLVAALGSPVIWWVGSARRSARLRWGGSVLFLLVAAAIATFRGLRLDLWRWEEPEGIAAISVAMLALVSAWAYRQIRSIGDRDQRPLCRGRVRVALVWAGFGCLLLTMADGVGLRVVTPIAAAIGSAAVGRAARVCWERMPRGRKG